MTHGGALRKPITFIAVLFVLTLSVVPAAWGSAHTTSDTDDGGGIAHLSHEDVRGVVKLTVSAFDVIRENDIELMRWDLDLDGDGKVGAADDGCILLRPVKGRRTLRAELHGGCTGDPVASADTRPKGNTLKVRLLLDELHDAGLDRDAAGYAYRFRSVGRDGSSDEAPDHPTALIRHTLGAGTERSKDAEPADQESSSDVMIGQAEGVHATARPEADATAARKRRQSEQRDTKATGTADEAVVEPGDDVEIVASGFARSQPLAITLVGAAAATSTATASPSASPTPTPTPTAAPQAQGAEYRLVSARAESAAPTLAGADAKQLGAAVSDEDGKLNDAVDIPEETKPGDYTIAVEGRNPTGGTHTVSIPIKVAAEVDDRSGNDDAQGQVGNATDTATQASPAAGGNAGTGTTLPRTGASHLGLLAGLGTAAMLLGGALLFARSVLTPSPVRSALPPAHPRIASLLVDRSELRGEMQRLLALRAHRDDPDRNADL